jgi:hypothetical protein
VSELNLILFGPPGAGKGTQAERLRGDFRLAFISTGEMLRSNVTDGTDLGNEAKRFMDAGDLVPDGLIVKMAAARIAQDDARDGFILDGFPRTIAQATALSEQLSGLHRRITAAQERGRLRPGRLATDPARRRPARRGAQSPIRLPREDEAADRLLRSAGTDAQDRWDPHADRGA